ncbi:TonB-linked outer membrane protein, SusC/RagA family [Fodinibius roseus]|uniref:TonB-linked outer membrane protein, SusC/RagA family n=1 Tax=Fodinibius roseus TaxID=1194090 RepID=A0A1M4YMJ5_9BACT|nr:SusC/RagA family TonB-linked outer membrane protein [Fodinibius roseus]SHF07045.1 TonB-linked outer membrane protein, SusC/RagA family [Fodinibius roseus]
MKNVVNCSIKIALAIVLISLTGAFAQAQKLGSLHLPSGLSQEKELMIEEGVSMKEALKRVEERFHVVFLYRTDTMRGKKVDSAKILPRNVKQALEMLLDGQGLSFKYLNPKTYGIYASQKRQIKNQVQEGSLSGTIVDRKNGEVLVGANVYIEELERGVSTDINGEYSLESLPTGEYTLRITYVGYREETVTITIGDGENRLNIELQPDLFGLDEVVVTGVVGDTETKNLPFTVQRVTSSDLEKVPSLSAESAIRGKVPGVTILQGSGEPGAGGMSVMLRGATSISGSNEPLYIVDGVILGSDMRDIESLDIESVEVIKGAAAATLYGSRAANGVIQIRTKRGKYMREDATQVKLRNEVGFNELPRTLGMNQSHAYYRSGDPDKPWIGPDGNPTDDRVARTTKPGATSFLDQEYPVPIYDHTERFFVSRPFYSNYISIARNIGQTNYALSFNNTKNAGVLEDSDGHNRKNIRLNIDSEIFGNLQTSSSIYYASSVRDDVGGVTPFFDLLFQQPDVDLAERDENGRYKYEGDPTSNYNNPLYDVAYIDRQRDRSRIMGSFDVRYNPFEWLELAGNFSYDRTDTKSSDYWPTFYNHVNNTSYEEGGLSLSEGLNEAINSSLTATVDKGFGNLATRTQFRYLLESTDNEYLSAGGQRFLVDGARTLGATDNTRQNLVSSMSTIKAEGYYLLTNLNYQDKYIVDVMGRRDGSSLFGADERWHSYYRLSGAYRISEEDWFNIQPINEFKLNASYGTAGGRPGFSYQYETWSVSGSSVSKGNLGNRNLKPESASELEFGLDLGLYDQFFLDLNYAESVTEDQILLVPLESYYGFNSQWQNAGTVESNTFEASLRAYPLQRPNTSLSFTFNFARTRSVMSEFDRPPQTVSLYFQRRDNEPFGNLYGGRFITDYADLEETYGGDYSAYFEKNDDGYLVPVGTGNSWQSMMWGETVVAEDGTELGTWGHPVLYHDDNALIGNTAPDFSLSLGTNFDYKGLSLYTLFQGEFGHDIYNRTRAWLYRDNLAAEQDQRGKAEEAKKPINYYQTLYRSGNPSSHMVEDGTYLKLREVSVSYSFDSTQLSSIFGGVISTINIGLIGRNLITWTSYSGYDPEVGNHPLQRVDHRVYPNFRTISGNLEIQF